MLGQKQPIGQLGAEYALVCDSQDTEAIRDYLGNREDCEYPYYFAKVKDGDYVEIWGSWTLIHLDSMATLLWNGSWDDFELFHADFSLLWGGLLQTIRKAQVESMSLLPDMESLPYGAILHIESDKFPCSVSYNMDYATEEIRVYLGGHMAIEHKQPNGTDVYSLDELMEKSRKQYSHRRIISILKGVLGA